MWVIESYTIEIRNSESCSDTTNIVASRTLKPDSLPDSSSGTYRVCLDGLSPGMPYWYCVKTTWVNYDGDVEMGRKTVESKGTFTTQMNAS